MSVGYIEGLMASNADFDNLYPVISKLKLNGINGDTEWFAELVDMLADIIIINSENKYYINHGDESTVVTNINITRFSMVIGVYSEHALIREFNTGKHIDLYQFLTMVVIPILSQHVSHLHNTEKLTTNMAFILNKKLKEASHFDVVFVYSDIINFIQSTYVSNKIVSKLVIKRFLLEFMERCLHYGILIENHKIVDTLLSFTMRYEDEDSFIEVECKIGNTIISLVYRKGDSVITAIDLLDETCDLEYAWNRIHEILVKYITMYVDNINIPSKLAVIKQYQLVNLSV